jgi:hypothetical protein
MVKKQTREHHALPADVRRALGLTLQIFEELPEMRRPESNMDDIRDLLGGQSSGRDRVIINEAIAMALAYQTRRMIDNAQQPLWADDASDRELRSKVYNAQMSEFTDLFILINQIDAGTFAIYYQQACIRLGLARDGDTTGSRVGS